LTLQAQAAGVSERTGFKWLARYDRDGESGLIDRSSRPHATPVVVPEDRISAIAGLGRLRMTGAQIAVALSMPTSTVATVLRRLGIGRLKNLEPEEPPNRYERRHPGELLHIDVKKLGRFKSPGHRVHGDRSSRSRGASWEYVHVCVDDATRVAYVEVLSDEKAITGVGFLRRAVTFYRSLGVEVHRVMTDNGSPYVSLAHAAACRALGLRHIRTRPYRPRTNGKAERFIRTMLNECLYAAVYQSSEQRRKVAQLRWDVGLKAHSLVWPFETQLGQPPSRQRPLVLHSEIWPGVVPFALPDNEIRDARTGDEPSAIPGGPGSPERTRRTVLPPSDASRQAESHFGGRLDPRSVIGIEDVTSARIRADLDVGLLPKRTLAERRREP
jgi:transposase InsO family protein